jgi:hypothetical protein
VLADVPDEEIQARNTGLALARHVRNHAAFSFPNGNRVFGNNSRGVMLLSYLASRLNKVVEVSFACLERRVSQLALE